MIHLTVANANTAQGAALQPLIQKASAAPPDGYVPLTPEGLLLFCSSQLKDLDKAIHAKMQKQQNMIGLQDAVTQIQSAISGGDGLVNGDDKVAFDNQTTVEEISGRIDEAIKAANEQGNPTIAKALESVKSTLTTGGPKDWKVTKEEVKEMSSRLDSALTTSRGGAEINMIEMQSLVSKRGSIIELTTNMMAKMDKSCDGIIANTRG